MTGMAGEPLVEGKLRTMGRLLEEAGGKEAVLSPARAAALCNPDTAVERWCCSWLAPLKHGVGGAKRDGENPQPAEAPAEHEIS